ncbi:uncharacterized protein LOC124150925 [Haliotis rufescens]|uniref:uncharacterized protein LOC124150925 n=1 Tax=Haliotis rufescens TaxID=6454 RepID=UPI001EAFE777|nr:uncharacterized protein LOC124150925 [Haliotis rufescens]
MTMKMMLSALLVTCAITLSSSQTLTNDDITSICAAVGTQGQCTSCYWCSVRKDGFSLKVKDLCRVRNSPSDCSLALSDFPCSKIRTFFSQSCSAPNTRVHQIVCPIAQLAASCFVTSEPTAPTATTPTATTTTVLTTTTTTMPSIQGPDVAPKTFRTPCTQRCVRNDIVASVCGASTLPEACTMLEDSSLDGQYTCCTG